MDAHKLLLLSWAFGVLTLWLVLVSLCMYVWMDGWMNGWMDGWMDVYVMCDGL